MENIIGIDDSRLITDILNRSFMTVAMQFNFTKENAPHFVAFIGPDVIENNLKNGLKMYGYSLNDTIIGCAGYSHHKDSAYFIERLAVLPEHRHMGVGRKLMEFAEGKIKEHGGTMAEVHVVDINTILIEWYKKLGYKEIRVDEIKSLPFNSCVMNKELL